MQGGFGVSRCIKKHFKSVKKWRVFAIMTVLFFAVACEKPLVDNELATDDVATLNGDSQLRKGEKISYSDGELELGKKLENPYSVKNMKTALQNLRKQSDEFKELKIEPNYYYVRVLPTNEAEFNLINSDESVDLFEYPLDYEIKKQGNKYKDKTLGDTNYTWLYCAVPTKKAFDNSLKVEVLEELFLPFGNGREDDYFKKTKDLEQDKQAFLEALENEALRITGNLGETGNKKAKVTTWYASGKIQVRDDLVNYNASINGLIPGSGFVPVVQCLVRARRGFTTKTALTTSNGSFVIPHGWDNGKNVEYSIKWDRPEFDIRSGNYGQAYFNGPDQTGSWNLNIEEATTPENYVYAHVHRGAYEYYYRHFVYGIQQPPTDNNSPLGGKMHLGAKVESCNNWLYPNVWECRAHYFNWNGAAFAAAEIRLPFDINDAEIDSRNIFGTTIHELAHASHWDLGFTSANYLDLNKRKFAESWAQAVGWEITRKVYANVSSAITDFDNLQGSSLANITNTAYTPLFIDLMDNHNQVDDAGVRPNDLAVGYTIGELENFLKLYPNNWTNYRNHLLNNNGILNDAHTAYLFDNYD